MNKDKKKSNKIEDKDSFYIVSKNILPESMLKVLEAKDIINKTGNSVNKVVKEVGISRTSYYKYVNCIFPFNQDQDKTKYEIVIVLKDEVGVMAKLTSIFSTNGYNILTIQQSSPLNNTTNIRVLLESKSNKLSIHDLINEIEKYQFIVSTTLLSISK